MSNLIDDISVEALAELARLEFSPEEMAPLRRQLGEILDFIATVEDLELDGTPLDRVDADPGMQAPDEIIAEPAGLLQQAPRQYEGFIALPPLQPSGGVVEIHGDSQIRQDAPLSGHGDEDGGGP